MSNKDNKKDNKVKHEKSAGAVVFYKDKFDKDSIKFLLLKYKTYWGFIKGIIESEENIEQTIKREAKEEANISELSFFPKFKYMQKWFYRREGSLIRKEAIYLLAEITKEQADNIKISWEHENFKFCTFDEALQLMKIRSNREMLKAAYKFIKSEKQKKLF